MVVIGLVLIKAAVIIVRYYLKKTNIDKALHKFIINFIKTVMLIILFILFLDSIRVDTKSIVTVLGISGGAIALALKDSLSNIAGGIIILRFRREILSTLEALPEGLSKSICL